MPSRSYENLKNIRFEGELLPNWAQLLDLASGLCPVSAETRHWFSILANSPGVEGSRMVLAQCKLLRTELQTHREQIVAHLSRETNDRQASQIFAAWIYSLDTMMQQASSKQICSWQIDGMDKAQDDEAGGGEIRLRRV